MPVAVAEVMPVDEADRELDGRLRALHEVALLDAEELQEIDDAGNRRLADADRGNVRRFDQMDRARAPELAGKRARSDPARRAAADDCDALDATIGLHASFSVPRRHERGTGRPVRQTGGGRPEPTAPCHDVRSCPGFRTGRVAIPTRSGTACSRTAGSGSDPPR